MLKDKVVIITGAGGGLGASHAMMLARHGAKVVVNDPGVLRDGSGGSSNAADGTVNKIIDIGGVAMPDYNNIATPEGAKALIDNTITRFGRIDVLINNAGILRDKTIHNMTDDMWDAVIAVHLKGTFLCTREAAKHMKTNGGSIINTTSVAGLKGNFGQSNYSAAKAGIYGLTLTTSMELKKDKIRVNSIAPLAKTRMTNDIDSIPDDFKPEHVSAMVLYLASDLAKDITGKTIGVHGKTIFEYKMDVIKEATSDNWTPEEINKWIMSEEVKPQPQNDKPIDSKLEKVISSLPMAFKKDLGSDWKAALHFKTDAGDWFVDIKDSVVTTSKTKQTEPTCVITATSATITGMIDGTVNSNMAFMTGKLKASNVKDLMKFGKCFSFSKLKAAMTGNVVVDVPKSLNEKLVGKKYSSKPMFITAESMTKYDAAVSANGSKIFPVSLVNDLFMQLLNDPEFNGDVSRMVHGEQTIKYFGTLHAGDLVSVKGQVTEISKKGSGEILRFSQNIFREGKLVVNMLSTLFFRGDKVPDKTKTNDQPDLSNYTEFASFTVTKQMINDYADASGDRNPIHIDENVAKSVGFKDVILHGLGTLANSIGHFNGNPSFINVRFVKPVYPGDTLKILTTDADGKILFKVVSENGIVLDNGVLG